MLPHPSARIRDDGVYETDRQVIWVFHGYTLVRGATLTYFRWLTAEYRVDRETSICGHFHLAANDGADTLTNDGVSTQTEFRPDVRVLL